MNVKGASVLLAALLLPGFASAATLRGGESLSVTEPLPGNAYLAGSQVDILAPIGGDMLAMASTIHTLAEVAGDALLAAGTILLDAPVLGDVRALGGQIIVTHPIAGEFAGLGGAVRLLEPAREIRVAGASVEALGGAGGPVTIYGNRITLGGVFEDSVRVVAADRVTVEPGTVIRGVLEYNAPQETEIPESVLIEGGVRYIGSASFLPTPEEAQAFALAGFGVFFVVRALAGMLAAGLLAGLFPSFARKLHGEALGSSSGALASFVTGFGALVLIPFLLVMLLASVVGIGIAFVLGAAYVFATLLAYLYGAVLLGALGGSLILKRATVGWRATLLGMLALYLIGLVPVAGFLVGIIFLSLALGAMLRIAYRFAFKSDDA